MSGSRTPDRRSVIAGGAAVVGMVALPRAGAAADEGLAPAADLLGKSRALLSGLEPDKRKAARLPGMAQSGAPGIISASGGTSNPACGSSR